MAKKDEILDCIDQMEERKECRYDIVNLDITSPFRAKEDAARLINKHLETNADITYSVTTTRKNPYFNQVAYTEMKGDRKVIMSDFTARQQASVIYDRNASLYAYKLERLKNDRDFNNGYHAVIEMYDTAVLDLDIDQDFELMGNYS